MDNTPAMNEAKAHLELGEDLQSQHYLALRFNPQPGEELYLCLSDLRQAMDEFATDKPIRILDYGCGCSPYRALFPNSEYRRADYLNTGGLDYRIEPGVPLKEKPETYDMVLSTQVLEHVDDPEFYLREAHRLLKVGGTLILSTHGTFPDHGCPYDYRRWTVDGLKHDLRKAGFAVETAYKLTTGPRAALMYLELHSERIAAPKTSIFGFIAGLFRRFIRQRRAAFHKWADENFNSSRVADGSGGDAVYVGLILKARK